MCCILCEEPVRSLTIGLAAIGVVTVVRTVQKALTGANRAAGAEAQPAQHEATAPTLTDSAP